eukprot:3412653-Prorocentrum_lima.AAC.1
MLEVDMGDLTAGNNRLPQGYEPYRADLELVRRQAFTVYTPRGRHDHERNQGHQYLDTEVAALH